MTAPITPPNTPIARYEQPRVTTIKKAKVFTFDVDFPTSDKRHQKLNEDQLKMIREKFLKKGNS